MKPSRILLLALVSLTTSTQVDNKVMRRQILGLSLGLGSGSSASGSSTVSPTPSAAPTTSPTDSNTDSAATTTDSQSQTTQASDSGITSPPSTSPTSTPPTTTGDSTSPSTSSSSSSSSSSSDEQVNTTATVSPLPKTTAVTTHTSIIVTDGQTKTSLSVGTTVITPSGTSLADGSNNNSSSGMSTKTRNTIIGVVVGVGAAVILGAAIILARRIFANRRNRVPEDDGLMEYNGYNGGMGGGNREKDVSTAGTGSAATTASPFQSTLESYHNPAGARNVSSNF